VQGCDQKDSLLTSSSTSSAIALKDTLPQMSPTHDPTICHPIPHVPQVLTRQAMHKYCLPKCSFESSDSTLARASQPSSQMRATKDPTICYPITFVFDEDPADGQIHHD
jgi:hypothetical protein